MAFSGTLYSFGHNEYAKLGNGNSTNQKAPVQITAVTSVGEYSTLSFSYYSTNLWACGYNSNQPLSLGSTGNTAAIVGSPISIKTTSSISQSFYSANLYGCGYNDYGQTGTGGIGTHTNPTGIPFIVNNRVYSPSQYSTRIWSCGYNNYAQLGQGSAINSVPSIMGVNISNVRTS